MADPDEFEQIARLYRPLTAGAPEALDLMDDAAVIAARPGFDLVVTKDAVVEGVHFLPGEALDLVARKLLRANLSDLAAKGAEPWGYLLAVAWPASADFAARERFAAGLARDQEAFGVRLIGGDTVSTSGPLVASLTLLGYVPVGAVVRRSGARAGDVLMVSGVIGDAGLGLEALKTGSLGATEDETETLVARHRLPTPRLALRHALRRHASAAADVSDGLVADAGHLAEASDCGVSIRLEDMPLSTAAAAWLARQGDEGAARLRLATSGDDYEIVCACPPGEVAALVAAAGRAGVAMTPIGNFMAGDGVAVSFASASVTVAQRGWTHR